MIKHERCAGEDLQSTVFGSGLRYSGVRRYCAIDTLDLDFMGTPQIIASLAVSTGGRGVALIETGPASTLGSVEKRLNEQERSVADIAAIFVTHVHLDHSGGAGTLAQRAGCPLYVHPRGVAHLVDPARLLASAERLYGDMMVPLWGITKPAPAELVRGVGHGETVRVGELEVRALHTPGHASHHVAWQVGDTIATGDVGGVRFPGVSHVLPPMPPPDIDVELWCASLALLRAEAPSRLHLTHFGGFDDPESHLDQLEERLLCWTGIAEEVVARNGGASELVEELQVIEDADLEVAGVSPENEQRYRRLCPMDGNSAGLFRYVSQV